MEKQKIKILTFTILGCIFIGCISTLFYLLGKGHTKVMVLDFSINEVEVEESNHKYKFLKKELSDYICNLCTEMDIDSDLIVGILMCENPEFDPEATNKNDNGTIDCGLFQLNDRYLYQTFEKDYWNIEGVELNPFNWKHNTYIAVHHIDYLQKKLKVQDDVIMAYNCGINPVMNNSVPDRTIRYAKNVKNNMILLKSIENDNE